MIFIPLQSIPNQSLSARLDNNFFNLNFKTANNITAVDIAINNNDVLQGARAVPGIPLIPYLYLMTGNFLILTMDGAYPVYTEFGISQFLVYARQAEIEAIRNGNA